MFVDFNDVIHNDGSFVQNQQGHGEVGGTLGGVRFDTGFLKPYINKQGQRAVTINTGRMIYNNAKGVYFPERRMVTVDQLLRKGIYNPVWNATTLRKESWIELDRQVLLAYRERIRAWSDLTKMNPYGGFDGMSKMTLEYEAMSDPHEALVDMDGLSDGRTDAPLFKLRSLPLPITHSDFFYSERRLAVSRNSGQPLDATSAEAAGRRCGEAVERTLIGINAGVEHGTQSSGITAHDGLSKVYGYTTLPTRITKTNLTVPLGTNPEATINDILAMRKTMYDNKFYGPYMIYHGTDWDQFMDNDYARLGGNNASRTLRQRIKMIGEEETEGSGGGQILGVRRLDFLVASSNPYTLLMVQMNSETAQAVNGMDITTVAWPSVGGLRQNYKVMCIQVPRLRYDYNGVAAILHATTS